MTAVRLSTLRGMLLALLAVAALATPARSQDFHFLAMGGAPHGQTDGMRPDPDELAKVDRLVDAANGSNFAFVVDLGNIKPGGIACRHRYFELVRIHLDHLDAPFIYTPGSNEWADCPRSGDGMSPAKALTDLRYLFFPNPRLSLGKHHLPVETQWDTPQYSTYVENRRWSWQGVWFATLHVIGDNDDLPDAGPGDPVEQAARSKAAQAWLAGTFAEARKNKALGVVLFMQADPWQVPRTPGGVSAYTPLLRALEQEIGTFRGDVLLMHDGGHAYCVDHPLRVQGKVAENFTRVQVFGETSVQGVEIHVDPEARHLFTPSKFVVIGNPLHPADTGCPAYGK